MKTTLPVWAAEHSLYCNPTVQYLDLATRRSFLYLHNLELVTRMSRLLYRRSTFLTDLPGPIGNMRGKGAKIDQILTVGFLHSIARTGRTTNL